MDSLSLHAAARTQRSMLLARLFSRVFSELKGVARDWRRTMLAAGPRGRLT